MFNLSAFSFTRAFPTRDGIVGYARYADWSKEFCFVVKPDGSVQGCNFQGNWLELSKEFGTFVKSRVQSALLGKE